MTTATVTLDDLSVPAPPPGPADWNDEGVVVLRDAVWGGFIDAYMSEWQRWHGVVLISGGVKRPHGWDYATPYMDVPELAELCCGGRLANALEYLIGEPAGVHLNLTGWVSTERNWHQDTYLNPPEVGDAYAAVWVALGDIHPDSGPFQYIPGSHRWHVLQRELIANHVDMSDTNWPKHTEDFLTPLVEDEIRRRGAEVVTYLPKRGDVLFWHPRLYHRGSKAKVPGAYRPALIAHYSGIHHRSDMPAAIQHPAGGWFFPIDGHQPV